MPAPWAVIGRFHRDARLFLVTSFVAGAALSLYWIDFNLYLAALGFSTAEIGLVSTVALGGFVLRTQIWRDPKDKRTYMQSDTMYGVKTLDPEKAFRIMG